jgi:uncharacterized protein YdhG (YjbR/CyaY superfamily)
MKKTAARVVTTTVTEYLADQPPASRRVLRVVRKAIRSALPAAAEECISYRIPAYKLKGKPVIYFAGWTNHYSLYPVTSAVMAAFGDALRGHVVSKGTMRFSLDEPVPVELIAGIAKVRGQEVEAGLVRRKR